MTKYVIPFLLFLVIALGLYGWLATKQAQEARSNAQAYLAGWEGEKRARELVMKAKINSESVLLARALAAEDRLATTKKVDRDIKQAIKANPVWADEPIPDGVRDALTSAGIGHKGPASSVSPAPVP